MNSNNDLFSLMLGFILGITLGILCMVPACVDNYGKLGNKCYPNASCDPPLSCFIDEKASVNKCLEYPVIIENKGK